jgi:AcrR family transcriptional regulator
MSIRKDRREAAIERMADHVLSKGLGAATLRPLAAAAGTSDRMLLYYFADKDELLRATLDRVAQRMLAQIDSAIPAEPRRSFPVLLLEVRAVLASRNLQPFMPLWMELAAGAARGIQPHSAIASQIADGFFAWIKMRLEDEHGGEPSSLASLFFTIIEGSYLLQAVDQGAHGDTAALELVRILVAGRSVMTGETGSRHGSKLPDAT